MNQKKVDLTKLKRVLIANLRHHGDVLLSSALFALLKKRFPHLEVDAYIYEETFPMLEGHPAISRFLFCNRKWKSFSKIKRLHKELILLRKIRKGGYDLVINLTEGDRGAIAALMAKCSYSVGFDPEGGGMPRKKKCYTHVISHTPLPRHTVEKQLDALRCLGIFPKPEERELFFAIPEDAKKRAQNLVALHQLKPGGFILIHPVSRWMFKTLPTEKIAQLITCFHERGEKIVLTASSDLEEIEMNQTICRQIPNLPICNLSGQISLKELGALIAMSRLLISVDSMPVHLACALKKPVLAIFGPTCEKKWGPWHNSHSRILFYPVSCRPCFRPGCGSSGRSDCLDNLAVESIFEAALDLL